MKVGEAVGQALVAEGVRLAAGMGGTHIGQIIEAIAAREQISLMYARQERVAFDICDGYARASGNPAVVFTDSGPAAANLMGGLVNSWDDSTPVLFFAGHVDRTEVMKAGISRLRRRSTARARFRRTTRSPWDSAASRAVFTDRFPLPNGRTPPMLS